MTPTTAQRWVDVLILSDVPLVTWGIQSSLFGLPGIVATIRRPEAGQLRAALDEKTPRLIVAAPTEATADGLCPCLAQVRREAPATALICLRPEGCLGHCRGAALSLPLGQTAPALLRRRLRQVLDPAETREVGEMALPRAPHRGERISRREREIGMLVAEGRSSQEIATRLFISPRTVEKHRANLMTKLEVTNAAALTRELLYLHLTEDALVGA